MEATNSYKYDYYTFIMKFYTFFFLNLIPITLLGQNDKIQFSSFTDSRDGKTYKTVVLDYMEIMAENLRYSDVESYSFSSNPSLDEKYGRLYPWSILMAGSKQESTRGICPQGWHLPSIGEWRLIINKFGSSKIAGLALKEGGILGLNLGLFGWYNKDKNRYIDLGYVGFYWTSSRLTKGHAILYLKSINSKVLFGPIDSQDAAYCRCVKD